MKRNKIVVEYYNDKKLSFCDFIKSIKEDLLKILSKYRVFIDYHDDEDCDFYDQYNENNEFIQFAITYYNNRSNLKEYIVFKSAKNFDLYGICVDNFVKSALNCANTRLKDYVGGDYGPYFHCFDQYYDDCFEYYMGGDAYYNKKCNINEFDKKFFVKKLDVDIYINYYKYIHKKEFYKDLHNDLMVIAWHPSRYLDWCIDVEELRDLKERWGEY